MVEKVGLASQQFPFLYDLVTSSPVYLGSNKLQSLSPQPQETDENSWPLLYAKLLGISLSTGSVKGESSEN